MATPALRLFAPLSGHTLALESVPDPVFAQKLVGNGIALDPTSSSLLAPCDGEIIQLHPAHHAVTVRAAGGTEVLLHIGLDTVKLRGAGFDPKVKVGDRVRQGQELIRFDADQVALKAKSLITVMLVTGETPLRIEKSDQVEAGQDVMIEVAIAAPAPTAPVLEPRATTVSHGPKAESAAVEVSLPAGLHARPAAQLVNLAKTFSSKIELKKGARRANAKSVVALLGLEVSQGEYVKFAAEGPDAKNAVAALGRFLKELREAPEAHAPPAPGPIDSAEQFPVSKTATSSNSFRGVSVSPGIAIGRAQQIRPDVFEIPAQPEGTPAQERQALTQAIETAIRDLQTLSRQVSTSSDATRAAIFAAHQGLLEDPDILEMAWAGLEAGQSAAHAWNNAIVTHADRLSHLNNELMAQRANDLRDVGHRVLRLLLPHATRNPTIFGDGVILIAENLTPSETSQLDRSRVFGFATTAGGATSHVAILARSLGLPALAGLDAKALNLSDGVEVILDADRGELRVHPTAADKATAERAQNEQTAQREAALKEAQKPAQTLDGQVIEVAANIGSVADAQKAVEMGADGVGLLRSEFLFLERVTAPSEDEQHGIYQQIADVLGPRPLIIRTLDVGGDKPLQYLPLAPEENPFLGIRGIRVGLKYPQILRTQLRAILRVRSQGQIHVMFPMIATLEEFRAARVVLEEERAQMKAPPIKVGIMVEVPSIALIADKLAREVDFFSIGTNDLTQYTLAMDRGNGDLAAAADALHPSVLKLIEFTCQAAKAHGKWVGVCGGLAGDAKAVPILLGLGVKELSVSVPTIPMIKSQVRTLRLSDNQSQALAAVRAPTAQEVRSLT